MTWRGENFGVALKALASGIEPGRPALLHGDRVIDWQAFDRITDGIAAGLIARGLKPGDAAGQMQRNSPEYVLAYFGCAKAGVRPVNVNYHYLANELGDIFTRFDLKALFVDPEFAERAQAADAQGLAHVLVADPDAAAWQELCRTPLPEGYAPHPDPDEMFYMATGGTTGMPKAVMWPFAEAWQAFQIAHWPTQLGQPPEIVYTLEDHVERAAALPPDHAESSAPMLLLCPLMHGTGQFGAMIHLLRGGTLATLPGTKFDPDAAIDAVVKHRARTLVMVGDAFSMPLADCLEARADAAEAIASLKAMTSSGAVFSLSVKERLVAVNPMMAIVDTLGSSESGGTAVTITTIAGTTGGGHFSQFPGRDIVLLSDDLELIPPGSGAVGMVARTGPLPLGYLGEDRKNAETFPVVGGQRYLITGDRAHWREDGSLAFIGRDNMCINTGGEKVFPEEVEAALQAHGDVADVRVVGIPDPRFGRKIAAVVLLREGCETGDAALDAHVRAALASYKVPRLYVFTQESLRLNNGKPDYRTAQRLAEEAAA
ncbi:AMP-binding protein [Parerythrobacter lacustris]|uniref:AMP-binding protein n=1 Tax=Parerythrobacter lacustris TaxID=2969984 RepID=A0ABT1XTT7_9SPHN|nr:AMP-binding protein [Parerythrobacter lacustris]MCR2835047.1 AMP-binding protein [Parerythrobacter lacustris]